MPERRLERGQPYIHACMHVHGGSARPTSNLVVRVPDGNVKSGRTVRRFLKSISDSGSWHRVLSDDRQRVPKLATFEGSDFSDADLQNRLAGGGPFMASQ